MPFSTRRVVIFGKTYPEPSTLHVETVCTGGVCLTTGQPVRMYPVPWRYLEGDRRYGLWDVVEAPLDRNPRDQRPESYKVDHDRLAVVRTIKPDADEWRARREVVFRDASWHYRGMDALLADNRAKKTSIGFLRPGSVERVVLKPLPEADHVAFERKCAELRLKKESDMFDKRYLSLDFLPQELRLHWRCEEPCRTCIASHHDMKVLDWGLLELARKKSWEAAAERLRRISDLRTHDFRLFLGNFAQHPHNFGVIGLWYPKRADQQLLL